MKLQHVVRFVVAVTLSFFGIIAAAPAAQAAPPTGISLGKTSGGSVLLGGQAEWSLAASNPAGGVEQYNLSFTDTLPTGTAYVSGSTSPTMFGEPKVITLTDDHGTPADLTDDTTHQVIIWENVSDLTPGSTASLSFRTTTDPLIYTIGSTISNSGAAYTSSDPREVPDFDANGNPITSPTVSSATSTATTDVIAIKVTKSEPSPEGELLRGLGDHQTSYTVKVTNNSIDNTDDILVTDYVPAGMEFLGCGNLDITGGPEYAGANNHVATVAGCLTPESVDTVTNPVGHPAGIYTKVVWNIGVIAGSGTRTFNYGTAIPQRANTTTWTGTEPTAASGEQAANLDNNSGPSTREGVSEQGLTNYVDVSASFRGAPVAATTSESVTAEDLRMQKSVSPSTFTQGQQATYTLNIATSEYNDADNMVITDVMPNGLCPLGTSDPTYVPVTGCEPAQGVSPTNATITKVEPQADGSYKLTIVPDQQALAHNGTLAITYKALMRNWYGSTDADPTSAGDGFTNTADITGTTDMRLAVNPPSPSGTVTVNDASSATISSNSPTISKLRQANVTPMKCSTTAGDYSANPAGPQYNLGDRVCFLLSVDFPAGVDTKMAQLTDFLPTNFAYESYQVIAGAGLVNSFAQPATATGGVATWYLGSGNPRIVGKGALFQVVLSATVVKSATATSTNPKTLDKENLAKFRWVNTAGQASSLRDSSVITMAPQPTVGIVKGIASINATVVDAGAVPGNVDGRTVRGGDQVTFRVDMNNQSVAGDVNGRTVSSPDVWDVLPTGITCADISAISDTGACFDAGTPGRPALTSGDTTSAVIRWQLPATFTVAPGAWGKLTYTLTVPAAVSVSTIYANTAAVASYATATNINDGTPVTVTNFPQSNIDAGVPVASQQVPAASDTSNLVTPDATVTKSVLTPVAANNSATQAVVGENATYTIGVKIPYGTTVYNARLTDALPTGVTFVGPATALWSLTGTSPATSQLPSAVTVDPTTGTLTFVTTFTNPTTSDQLFEVTVPVRVNTDAANIQGKVLTNTATFKSSFDVANTQPVPDRTASANLTVVAPLPTITKTASPSTNVSAGSTVTYTVTPKNTSGRPTLYDAWTTDCLPNSMTFGAYTTTTPVGIATLTPEAGTGTNGCAVGFTRLGWNVGSLVGNATAVLKYTATVNANPVGQATYRNTATVTGSTLNDAKADPLAADNPNERASSAAASATITAGGVTISKTGDQTLLAPGQDGTYTVTVVAPANLGFYDAAIIDTLPTGTSLVSTDSITCTNADSSPCTILGGALAASGSNVGWTIGDLALQSQARTIVVKYTAKMTTLAGNTAGTVRQNSAKFSWMLTDKTMPGNAAGTWDTSSATANFITQVIEPGLRIAKSVDDTTVEPGQVFTYTVTASNNAVVTYSAPAYNVVVTDLVPAGVVVDSGTLAAPAGGTVAIVGNLITWTAPGPLAPNASLVYTYKASLAVSATLSAAAKVNTATVTGYDSLPSAGRHYTGPNTTATVTPQFPHVTPTKTVASGPAYLGQPKSWTLTITSDGNATARNVTATDTLPANWAYTPGSATVTVAGSAATQVEPTISGQVLTWTNLGDIPNTGNTTATITYTASPNDPDAATLPGVGSSVNHTNTVAVTAQDATGATTNASAAYNAGPASASTHIDSADVKVVKVGDLTPVAGQSTSWTLTVSNTGPDTAVGPFTLTDTLPTGVGLNAVSASGTGWTCSVTTLTVTCTRTSPANTLASAASFPAITISAQIPASIAPDTSVVNTATVTSGTYDPAETNNTDTFTGATKALTDIGVTKAAVGTMVPGTDFVWTINVSNAGPSNQFATIKLSDPMPAGLKLLSADGGPDWDCTVTDDDLTCEHTGGLAAGASVQQIVVTTHVGSGVTGDVTNKVTIDAGPTDTNPANDTATATVTAHPVTDLGIVKAHQGTFTAGANGTYKFTVTNFGPSDAVNAKVTDTLPSGLSFVSASGTGSCTASGQDVTCDLGTVNAGDSPTFEVIVAIDPAQVGDIVNTATVSTSNTDVNSGNDTSTDTTGTDVSSDLGIKKSHTGDATAGENLDFSLVVTNHGSSDNPGPVTVTDAIPDGMSFVSTSGSGWNCDHSGQDVTCTRNSGLGAGNSDTVTLTVHVAHDAGPAVLTNHANVASTTPDPDPSNNTDTDDVTVNDSTEISVTKTASPSTVLAGNQVTYTLVVSNTGSSDADSVAVYDPLAPGLTLVSVDANGWNCDAIDSGAVNCSGEVLAAGDSHTVTVVAKVGSGVTKGTDILNEVQVSTTTAGDTPAGNTDEATITVDTAADLSVAKTHEGDTVAGQQVTFDLLATNDGPSDAQAPIRIIDTLPAGLTFLGSTGDWTCIASGQEIACELNGGGSLLAGQDAPALHITAQIDSDLAPADAEQVNSAVVSSPTTEVDPENNTDTDTVTVTFSADLQITKTHTVAARIGDLMEFTMTVANTGPSTARQVTVTDTLPTGMTFVAASGTSWDCTGAGQDVTCDLNGTLAAGAGAEPITLTVLVGPAAYPSVDNTASVDATTPDPDNDNNTAADKVPVPAQADLSITKSHAPEPMQVGQQATYTLTVTNAGPTENPGPVTVTDMLPDGLTYNSSSNECQSAGQSVTCTVPLLKVGESISVTVTANVEPGAYPQVTNTAAVTSGTEDVDPGNNTATDTATVAPLHRLTLEKTLSGSAIGRADWQLVVTNLGPNEAPNGATVIDNLPGILSFDSYTGDGWTCAAAGRTVTCDYAGPIPVHGTATVTLHTLVAAGVTEVSNTASIVDGWGDEGTSIGSGKVPTAAEELARTGGVALGLAAFGLLLAGLGVALTRARRPGIGKPKE